MSAEDIKATVWDYSIGKCSKSDMIRLQRYFLREFITWMPLRAIAEQTGAGDHTVVLKSIKTVETRIELKIIADQLKKIFNDKLGHYWMLGNQHARKH